MRLAALAVALALVAPTAQAETVLGAGARASCGRWLEETNIQDLRLAWVMGWLSRSTKERGDILADTDASALRGWLDTYCRANPLESLFAASLTLEAELSARHQKARR